MEKILISACLIGDKTRYDGKSTYNPLVKDLLEKYELVPFCGEVEGGLSTPRLPSERQKDGTFKNKEGRDVTRQYKKGAELGVNIAKYLGIKIAILKEASPMCGVHEIHDGSFSGKKIPGSGILKEQLEALGIRVISENEIEDFLKEER